MVAINFINQNSISDGIHSRILSGRCRFIDLWMEIDISFNPFDRFKGSNFLWPLALSTHSYFLPNRINFSTIFTL